MSCLYSKFRITSRALSHMICKSYCKKPSAPSKSCDAKTCATKKTTKPAAKAKKPATAKRGAAAAAAAATSTNTGGATKSTGSCGRVGGAGSSPPVKLNFSGGIVDKCDEFERLKGHHSKPFRLLSFCLIPMIIAMAAQILTGHEEHKRHFVPYEYLYIHTKRFAWGDGRKSFFHGPNNLLPDEEMPNYKKLPDPVDEDLKRRKELRDQHAKEELQRRKMRKERGG